MGLGKICKEKGLFHVINNAYVIYCTKIIDMLNKADKIGEVSLVISSTDKNFMVPVGGAFIYSFKEKYVEGYTKTKGKDKKQVSVYEA